MSLKNDCSLKNTTILRNLILENPDLPLLIFVGEDAWQGDYPYNQVYCQTPAIEYLTLYGETWLDEDDYEEKLTDDLACEDEYRDLSDKEFKKMVKDKVDSTEFIKAIVVYVD